MVVTYRYDRMNRLVCEDRGGEGERYAYDPAGNRLERQHYRDGTVDGAETYRYNERNELTCRINRLTGSAAAYRYDACGNLLLEEEGGKKKEYGYDALNRLARVRTADGRVWENLYDGEGLRAGTRGSGACTTFLYRNGEILAECGEDGDPVSRYVYGRGLSHVQTLRDGIYHAYHCDEQGSTAYMTGPDGGVENSYRYDAFGNLLERKETVPNRILYTGQQYDQETGQYYLRARYYNPVVGRFLQEDTYHGDELNLYAYCANNPVVYYDPSGHDSAAVMKKAEEPDLPVGVGKGGSGHGYSVDPTMFLDDETAGVLRNGEYVKNPTAHSLNDYISEGSNYLGSKNMNGQYMYVVDMDGNIIIGTRGGQRMPHPTLVGGRNPQVQAAGIVEIRGGKIYYINNASGHFKPSIESLEIAEDAFSNLPQNIFSKDFQGYLPYGD